MDASLIKNDQLVNLNNLKNHVFLLVNVIHDVQVVNFVDLCTNNLVKSFYNENCNF
jgi:hypothetical protein